MHVLLIEPDLLLAETYQLALSQAGHSVSSVRSAQAAVHSADEKRPDVVVLELQLPVHNGVEFLYEFRSYIEWLTIPVIINSFVPPHEYDDAAILKKELGVSKYLHKPATSLQQFVMAIDALQPVTTV